MGGVEIHSSPKGSSWRYKKVVDMTPSRLGIPKSEYTPATKQQYESPLHGYFICGEHDDHRMETSKTPRVIKVSSRYIFFLLYSIASEC